MKNRCIIIVPCYEDSDSLGQWLPSLATTLRESGRSVHLLVVDDSHGGDHDLVGLRRLLESDFPNFEIVQSPFNLGHQEALVFGIRHVVGNWEELADDDFVITMDADGQDDVRAIPHLLDAVAQNRTIAVAKRVGERPEGPLFSVFYHAHKLIFRYLVGFIPDFGNYAAFDVATAKLIARSPHFDCAFSSALSLIAPISRVPSQRLPRAVGGSKVGFAGMIEHSLRGYLPHLRTVSRRVAVMALIMGCLSIVSAISVGLIRIFAPQYAFANWATIICSGVILFCMQLLMISGGLFLSAFLFRLISANSRLDKRL